MKDQPKYRVYEEPPWEDGIRPEVYASYMAGLDIREDGVGEVWNPMVLVPDPCFVLNPSVDPMARLALLVYSSLISESDPNLSEHIHGIVMEEKGAT